MFFIVLLGKYTYFNFLLNIIEIQQDVIQPEKGSKFYPKVPRWPDADSLTLSNQCVLQILSLALFQCERVPSSVILPILVSLDHFRCLLLDHIHHNIKQNTSHPLLQKSSISLFKMWACPIADFKLVYPCVKKSANSLSLIWKITNFPSIYPHIKWRHSCFPWSIDKEGYWEATQEHGHIDRLQLFWIDSSRAKQANTEIKGGQGNKNCNWETHIVTNRFNWTTRQHFINTSNYTVLNLSHLRLILTQITENI